MPLFPPLLYHRPQPGAMWLPWSRGSVFVPLMNMSADVSWSQTYALYSLARWRFLDRLRSNMSALDLTPTSLQNLADYVDECIVALGRDYGAPHPIAGVLQEFVASIVALQKGQSLDLRPADYFYRLLAYEPFASLVKNGNRARNRHCSMSYGTFYPARASCNESVVCWRARARASRSMSRAIRAARRAWPRTR